MPPHILLPLSLPPRTLLLCSNEMTALEELHETAKKNRKNARGCGKGAKEGAGDG